MFCISEEVPCDILVRGLCSEVEDTELTVLPPLDIHCVTLAKYLMFPSFSLLEMIIPHKVFVSSS